MPRLRDLEQSLLLSPYPSVVPHTHTPPPDAKPQHARGKDISSSLVPRQLASGIRRPGSLELDGLRHRARMIMERGFGQPVLSLLTTRPPPTPCCWNEAERAPAATIGTVRYYGGLANDDDRDDPGNPFARPLSQVSLFLMMIMIIKPTGSLLLQAAGFDSNTPICAVKFMELVLTVSLQLPLTVRCHHLVHSYGDLP
nr:hypothetical protein CFP56_68700 [Quercus suber]